MSIPNIEGKINNFYSSNKANYSSSNNDQYCKVYPNVQFSSQGGQWWVTTFFDDHYSNDTTINGLLFSIELYFILFQMAHFDKRCVFRKNTL
jgi:hypothetical protein